MALLVSHVIVEEFWVTFLDNTSVYWDLWSFIYTQISECFATALWFFSFSLSVLDVPTSFGSLCCCITHFGPSIRCWTDGLTFHLQRSSSSITARRPDPLAAKEAQIICPPLLCSTVGTRCLCWYAVFVCFLLLFLNVVQQYGQRSPLVLTVQRTFF